MRFSLTSVDETDARRAVARAGPTSGQRRRPRRNFTILRHAEGQAKKDLEKKVEEAKVKRDVAAKKLEELKEAAPDRWEKIKEGVGNAFDELKMMFK